MVKNGSVCNADSTPPTHSVESDRFLVDKNSVSSLIFKNANFEDKTVSRQVYRAQTQIIQ